jgi:PIF1-like helicase
MLDSDDYWHECLLEGATWQSAPQLRFLFAIILVHCHPAEPLKLWMDHWEELSDNGAYQLQTNHTIAEPTDDQIQSFALCHLRDILRHEHNSDFAAHNLPAPTHEYSVYANIENRLIADERAYDVNMLRATVKRDSALLNADQRTAFDALSTAVEAGDGGVYFLDGYGGTGKTFTVNLTLAQARANGHIAIAVASSGIAAVLLDGGTTAHLRFKIPIDINAESTCNIPVQGHLAELIREAKLVFWDEAPMQHRHCMEAVDRTFRDIWNDPRPFGGVVFCFCGDFRQILPVYSSIADATITKKVSVASEITHLTKLDTLDIGPSG